VRTTVLTSYTSVDPVEWDTLVAGASPFLEHRFLVTLETTGCAAPEQGWHPRPILVRDDAGRLVAAAPGWLKDHSMGEFVYDHGWANAAHRAGFRYYPKLVIGVPFSPVTGPRLLGDPAARGKLLDGVAEAAKGAHGVHFLFDTAAEAHALEPLGYFPRLQYQFHWTNEGYSSWEDFAARFPSKQRSELRRERKKVGHLRIDSVVGPDRADIDALYAFYSDTTARHFYGNKYLTRELFRALGDMWGDRIHAVLVRDGSKTIAGAFNVIGKDRLYGRYWGALAEVPYLHFEVCYHQGIEFAISRGLSVFEPGHGGEHKYRRGFLPTITWSSHQLTDPRLHLPLQEWSRKEAQAVRAEVDELRQLSPLRS
jgi:predicted N-acyltransferase